MTRPEINRVEVDMVPLIDIISLLLMFLIVVGDSVVRTTSVEMKLPRASAAEKEIPMAGQITIELDKNADGVHAAVVNKKRYKLDSAIKEYLDSTLASWGKNGHARLVKENGIERWNVPVKLRIPEWYPMGEVEKLVKTLSDLKVLDVRYAAMKDKDESKK